MLRRSQAVGGVPGGALALLAFAVLALSLAVPSKAQADVLVSNLNQFASYADTSSYVGNQFRTPGGKDDIAQGFTTGTNADGYTLTSIEFAVFGLDPPTADIGDLTASVHGRLTPRAIPTLRRCSTWSKPASIVSA